MASGAESPRQKMINLMYLVFIAMLALNMSKEVLTTFGEIEREVSTSSKNIKANNTTALTVMKASAKNDSIVWNAPYTTVSKIAGLSDELVSFIDDIKIDIRMRANKEERVLNGRVPDSLGDYERMDNSQSYDELFFKSGTTSGYTEIGDKFKELMDNFREFALLEIDNSTIGSNDSVIKQKWDDKKGNLRSLVSNKFNTDSVKVARNKTKNWLNFNFEGFPEIGTTTKLTLIQEDAENLLNTIISNVNEIILGENLNTLQAIVRDVNVFYENSKLEGKIALGKYDETFIASSVTINNKKYRADQVMENGEVVLEKLGINVGKPGAKKLTGAIEFERTLDGEDTTISIPIDHEYFVNPPLANVSNTDMNIVYMDIENPLKISMPGVSNENIQILNPSSIRKGKNPGEYVMVGEKGKRGKVAIRIKDKLSGITAPDVIFDVVKLPAPIADFSGKGSRQSKQQIASGRVSGTFNNERLDNGLKLTVSEFRVRIGLKNLGVVRNTGGAFSDRVKREILKARKGEVITISGIQFVSTKIDKGTKPQIPKNDIVLTVR